MALKQPQYNRCLAKATLTRTLRRLDALLSCHDFGDSMADRGAGLLDVLLRKGYCNADLQGRHGHGIGVFGFDGVAEGLRLQTSNQDTIRECL